MNNIIAFRGDNYFLSNFYETIIVYDGIKYRNSEAAFQAQKCMSKEEKERFSYLSASEAKRLGRRVFMRKDWNAIKVSVMENVLRAKFEQHPDLKQKLIGTGTAQLVEGNTWGDKFWGADIMTGRGQNMLGELLMKLRTEYSLDSRKKGN